MPSKERKNDKAFSSTEVGVLIEDLKSSFNVVAEETRGLSDRMGSVENRLTRVEDGLSVVKMEVLSLKDVVRIALPNLSQRITVLESKVGV